MTPGDARSVHQPGEQSHAPVPDAGRRRRRGIVLAHRTLGPQIVETAATFHIELMPVDQLDRVSALVESGCPELIFIDTDLLPLPGDLCRMARSLRPDVLVVALVNHWSEREERLSVVVDAVLHKPPRLFEWQRLFSVKE
jgi:hypothetical protein